MANSSHNDEAASVLHLVELGYVDPEKEAASQAALHSRLEADLGRAIELHGSGRGQEAVDLLHRIASDDPELISPRQILAEIQFRAGNWNAARPLVDWLAHHNTFSPRLALMAGALALADRDLSAALGELKYASYVEPTLPGVQSLLGTTLLRLGQWEAAEGAFEQALRQNPKDAPALEGLAAVALRRENFESAVHWALEALKLNMQQFRAHFYLGIALAHLHRTEAASEAFATCARLEPLRAAPFHWLSRIADEHLGDAILATSFRERGQEVIRQRRCHLRK